VLGEELLAQLRDVFLLRMGVTPAHLPAAEVAKVQVWADQLGDRATTRALEALGEALLEMRQAPDPRIPLEVALVKLTRTDGDTSLDGLVARIAKLEAALAAGIPAAPAPGPAAAAPAPAAAAPAPAAAPTPAPPSRPTSAPPAASAPAAASARGEGPAALARAKLAEQRAASSNRPGARPAPTPAPAPPAPAPAPPAPPAASPPAAAPATPAPSPSAPAPEVVAPTPIRDVAAPTSAPAPTGDLDALWSDRVLPALSGLTKAMYQSARLVGLDGGSATVGVDNDHHRDNCERKRPDVERALSEVVGRPLTVRFEVGGLPATSGDAGRPGAAPAPVSDDPEEHLAGADVHDLDDAPDAPTGGLSALTEAFPGAEIIEEA
jgi:DNA polymerase-3 subunit gamma/tau